MAKAIQAIRGMSDILPDRSGSWQQLERTLAQIVHSYGYSEIRTPIVEMSDLFKRSIGEVTDIVEKEMYTFSDRNGDSLTLRPEGTASCVRAAMQHSLLNALPQRLWYMGPMFRHERPQKGRYRQFHQFGAEVYGLDGPDIDAEQIIMTARIWQALGLSDQVTLQLNSLGTAASRNRYREELVRYFSSHSDQLDEDSQRRLHTNPLRILDSKNPSMQPLITEAPQLSDWLDEESKSHFEQLCQLLTACGVSYQFNSRLVRGLDYYGKTVFEWVTEALGAQGTVCAGGRYDGLVEQLGGKPVTAVGFAMGLERLLALLELQQPPAGPNADLYMVLVGAASQRYGMQLAEQIRSALPQLQLITHCGGGSFKSQFKKADRSGAKIALVIGETEVETQTIGCKPMDGGEQQQLSVNDLLTLLQQRFA